MDPTGIMSPLMQFGFAGLSASLLGVLIWLVKSFISAMKCHNDALVKVTRETTNEIAKNTAAIAASFDRVHDVHDKQLATLQATHQELLQRPCLLDKK